MTISATTTNTALTTTATDGRDLVLTRVIKAPPAKVFAAWTDPALLVKWFAPRPWTTAQAQTDVRPGGVQRIVMRGPDGTDVPSHGVYLEVVTDQRLVFTDAFRRAWEPSDKPFLVVELTFAAHGDQAQQTRYTARVKHWSVADREAHEAMGFHTGWTVCAEQLAALVEAS